ncbi:MAG TPA: PIN domain-containing protein [Steroidobacteraceae bacterium]
MASRSGSRRLAGAPRSRVPAATETFRYIESSALLAALLEGEAAARTAIAGDGRRVTSALTFAESSRAVIRARVTQRLAPADEKSAIAWLEEFKRRCDILAVGADVLERSGRPFPVEPIRTLHAIHLASAESLGVPPQLVTIVTRDIRVRDNARALGYIVE